jgi:shikimate dehydrogenase
MSVPKVPVDGATRVVGIIGDPVGHSRSPAMHNAAFRALGLNWVYVPFPVYGRSVGAAVRGVRALGLAGLNVTVPHKETVLRHLDELTETARACLAVNTIVNRRGTLVGDNTDAPGLMRDFTDIGIPEKVDMAVVLGAGGAARAAAVALTKRARRVVIAARRSPRARALARDMNKISHIPVSGVPLAELAPGHPCAADHLGAASLVVNATAVGMSGEEFFPLEVAATPRSCRFYDLIYTQKRTPFLELAAKSRRPISNGLGMLLHQGALAFTAWTGEDAPIDVMRRALRSPG